MTYFTATHFGRGVYEGEVVYGYGQYQDSWTKDRETGAWRIAVRNAVLMVCFCFCCCSLSFFRLWLILILVSCLVSCILYLVPLSHFFSPFFLLPSFFISFSPITFLFYSILFISIFPTLPNPPLSNPNSNPNSTSTPDTLLTFLFLSKKQGPFIGNFSIFTPS